MNVSSLGYTDPYTADSVQGSTALTGIRRRSDGDDDDNADVSTQRTSERPHRHAGGQVGDAVMQALQSLGLTIPAPPTDSAVATAASTTGDSSSTTSTDGSADDAAPVDLRRDMGDLLHALFQAVKGDSGSTAATGATTSADGGTTSGQQSFASGLSALITQAANGTAPAGLESAFQTLSTDLQSISGTADTATATTSASTSDDTSNASLQAFLAKLQDSLGYGGLSSSGARSSLIDSQA